MEYFASIHQFQQTYGVPMAVNEFGVVRWAPNAAEFLRDEIEFFEQQGMNHALWVWEPAWAPWYTWGDKAMFYPFGPDPNNMQEVESDLFHVIRNTWRRNTLHPFGRNE